MKQTAKFNSPDGSQNLVISAITSTRTGAINVKATLKDADAKQTGKRATTGCRRTFKTDVEAQKAFDRLVKETEGRGWTTVDKIERNAFTSIPEAPGAKESKKSKAA